MDLARLEADLWEAADNLRANSKLTSSDYFMPVLGVIFLRHAANRFDAASAQIKADQASGKMPQRKLQAADYIRRRALWLTNQAIQNAQHLQMGAPVIVLGLVAKKAVAQVEKSKSYEFPGLINLLARSEP